jgi:hypothetical protein
MKRPDILCHKCNGSGREEMPKLFHDLWKHLAKPRTAEELLGKIPDEVGITAINNRLERMRAIGLLNRVRHGKFWKYYGVGQSL